MTGPERALCTTARYGGLAIGLSWAIGVPAIVGDRTGRLPQSLVGVGLAGFVAGPAAAALILATTESDRTGWRMLLDRFRRRSFPQAWWLAIPVAGVAATATASAPLRHADVSGPGSDAIVGALVAAPIIVAAASLEEIGWRGYLLPRLQHDVAPAIASVLIGVPWAIWHLPLLLLPTGPNSQVPAWFYVLGPLVGSFLYTGLFNATSGSVLVVAAVHGVRNVVSGIFLKGQEQSFDPTLAYAADIAVVLVASVAIFATTQWCRRCATVRPITRRRSPDRTGLAAPKNAHLPDVSIRGRMK